MIHSKGCDHLLFDLQCNQDIPRECGGRVQIGRMNRWIGAIPMLTSLWVIMNDMNSTIALPAHLEPAWEIVFQF